MRNSDHHVIAILCSDLHLSSLKPACRAEENWFSVQSEYLSQLNKLAHWFEVPVICAGDIFDRWNANSETINFALQLLPDNMICVAGQHDLPNHRMDQMFRSAYGVLKEAGKIIDICGKTYAVTDQLMAYGYGWGQEIKPCEPAKYQSEAYIRLAVIHKYCWTTRCSYPGAENSDKVGAYAKRLKGYDAAVFGDNHIGFCAKAGTCNVINTGGFIRRKSDELDYSPRVGLLMSDGSIDTHFLETKHDKFVEIVEEGETLPLDMQAFIKGLKSFEQLGTNFREIVENHLRQDDIDGPVKDIILEALET